MSKRVEQHRAAAKWWREAIVLPGFDNGDNSFAVMAAKARSVPTPDQLDAFEAAVFKTLENAANAAEANPALCRWDSVGVDYHPDCLLHDAFKTAFGRKPSTADFPIKSHVNIRDDRVTAKLGHTGERKVIWGARPEEGP